MLLWPCPAAAAGAPGVPGFLVCAVPPDDGGQAAGAAAAGAPGVPGFLVCAVPPDDGGHAAGASSSKLASITSDVDPFIQQSVFLTSQMCILAVSTARKGHISVKGHLPCPLAKRQSG